MIRKQLYLDEALNRDLKALARRTGESEATHVRRALGGYLEAELAELPSDDTADSDPLLELVGLAGDSSAPIDLARNHDHYLYGAGRTEDEDAG